MDMAIPLTFLGYISESSTNTTALIEIAVESEYEPDRDQADYHSADTVVDEFLPADFVYYEHRQDGCKHIHETHKDS